MKLTDDEVQEFICNGTRFLRMESAADRLYAVVVPGFLASPGMPAIFGARFKAADRRLPFRLDCQRGRRPDLCHDRHRCLEHIGRLP